MFWWMLDTPADEPAQASEVNAQLDAEVQDLKRRAARMRPAGIRFSHATRRDVAEVAALTANLKSASACYDALPRGGMGRALCMDSMRDGLARLEIIEAQAQGKRPPLKALVTVQERRVEQR